MRAVSPGMREALSALLATSLVTCSTPALAVDKITCVDAAEAGQSLRKEGRLVSARDRFVVCASPDCPEVVSQDCTGWLGEVQRSLASVIVKARDAGGEPLSDVGVSLDGVMRAERAPTATIEIDPGDHVFRCERAGFTAAEPRVHLAQGERGREVICQLASLAPAAPSEAPQPLPAQGLRGGPAGDGAMPWIVWPLGGLGLAGGGGFAALALSAQSDERALFSGNGACAPYCRPSQVDPIRAKFLVADVSLAVGLVALGIAAVISLLHLTASPARVSAAQAQRVDLPGQLPPLQVNVAALQYPLQH